MSEDDDKDDKNGKDDDVQAARMCKPQQRIISTQRLEYLNNTNAHLIFCQKRLLWASFAARILSGWIL